MMDTEVACAHENEKGTKLTVKFYRKFLLSNTGKDILQWDILQRATVD